jgi:O-acetylhomoserine (thiol)-lyase
VTRFDTNAVHASAPQSDVHGALRTPVYDTAAFEFADSATLQGAFEGRQPAHTYSRSTNPTVEAFEQGLNTLAGGLGTVATASGMAAITEVVMALGGRDAKVVTSRYVFGNTISLLTKTLGRWGLDVQFVDMRDMAAVASAIDDRTALVFLESITNPQLQVADVAAIAEAAAGKGVPVVLDGTATTPYLFRSRDFGVAIEVLSTTKYVAGGGTSIGGAIIDTGRFDWRRHGRLADAARRFGPHALLATLRREVHRNLGGCLAPHNAYLQSLGLETLALRVERSCANAMTVAQRLAGRAGVLSVNYPGLPGSPDHAMAQRQFGDRYGGILTFELADKVACFRFMDNLTLIRRATNIGDNKTLALHPASTIYCEYKADELAPLGVSHRMIRLSVGIDDPDDVLEDLDRGLAAL